jgi:hypothetical protein
MQAIEYIKLTGVAAGVSAGLFISYKAYKAIVAKRAENKETKDYKKAINKANLSYSETDYKTMADVIHTALNQPWNDDEKTVYKTLERLKTKDDWFKLVEVFGLRKRNRADFFSSNMNLPQYLQEALEYWEREKVKAILSKIGVVF